MDKMLETNWARKILVSFMRNRYQMDFWTRMAKRPLQVTLSGHSSFIACSQRSPRIALLIVIGSVTSLWTLMFVGRFHSFLGRSEKLHFHSPIGALVILPLCNCVDLQPWILGKVHICTYFIDSVKWEYKINQLVNQYWLRAWQNSFFFFSLELSSLGCTWYSYYSWSKTMDKPAALIQENISYRIIQISEACTAYTRFQNFPP